MTAPPLNCAQRQFVSRAAAVCAWLLGLSSLLPASEIPIDLLRLVKADAGLVLVGTDMERQVQSFRASKLFSRIEAWPAYADWLESGEYEKLLRAEASIARAAGKPFPQVLREIVGQDVVLAAFPQENVRPTLLLISETSDEKALASALAAWNTSQAELEAREHAGHEYFQRQRIRKNGEPTRPLFWTSFGSTFVLAEHEDVLQSAIDLHTRENSAGSLLTHGRFNECRSDLPEETAGWCYVRPRAWDDTFDVKEFDPFGLPLASYAWASSDALIASLRIESGLVLEVSSYSEERKLRENAPDVVAALGQFPRESFVAFAGQADLVAAESFLDASLDDDQHEKWVAYRNVAASLFGGLDPLHDAMNALQGPWGFCLIPHSTPVTARRPADLFISFGRSDSASGAGGERRQPVDEMLDRGMQAFFHFVTTLCNAEKKGSPAVVKTGKHAGDTVRWIDNFGTLAPAGILTASRVLLATTPELVRNAVHTKNAESLASSPAFQRLAEGHFAGANHLLWIDTTAIQTFVGRHREYFIKRALRDKSATIEAATENVASLEEALRLFDAAFVTVHAEPDRTRVTIGAMVDE